MSTNNNPKMSSTASIASINSKKSSSSTDSYQYTKHLAKIYEIDFIGGETYRVTDNYILQKRSLEPINHKDSLASLSARGLYHRDKDYFCKELSDSTQLIHNLSKAVIKGGSHQLYLHYFQRALAQERLGERDKAIEDYTMAIRNDRNQSQAYFNRSGLFQAQGNFEAALKDLNKAIQLHPSDRSYRTNRALLHRRMGNYVDAIQDTMVNRALEIEPQLANDLILGKEINLNPELLGNFKKTQDPILKALKKDESLTGKKRKLDAIVDFIKTIKFFSKISEDLATITRVADRLELMTFKKGEYIFEEGDRGMHFFIVLDGEISIVKAASDGHKKNVLVKLFRGHAFGETALEIRGGKRTAGAMASQPSNLMALHVDDYQSIVSKFDSLLKEEIKSVLRGCEVFKDWTSQRIEHLSDCGMVRNYSALSQIIKEGERNKYLYIIKTGVVQVLKKIEKPDTKKSKHLFKIPDSELEREAPGNWVIETNWKSRLGVYGDKEAKVDPKYFVTAVKGSGEVLGELAILDPEIRNPTTATAYTNVELYCFESDVLITLGARFNSNTMNALNESLNLSNPPAEKIAFYFRSKLSWEKNKRKILKKINELKC